MLLDWSDIDVSLTPRLEAVAELEAVGMGVAKLDVTSVESINAAVDLVLSTDGRIDMLVCNAGRHHKHAKSTFACLQQLRLPRVRRFLVYSATLCLQA